MEQIEVQNNLINFVVSELLNDRTDVDLQPQDDLLSSQLVDSLGVMRIIAFLEERYGIRIPPSDVTIENFIDVQTISTYLVRSNG